MVSRSYKRLGNTMNDDKKASRGHDRWNELCSRCGLPCWNTGARWIDGTKVCRRCREILTQDIQELQAIQTAFHEKELTNEQLVERLSHHQFKIYPLVKKHDKNGRDGK